MPQRFGLYEDLSVAGEPRPLRRPARRAAAERAAALSASCMEMTELGPFTARLAGQLSGGMKQKLGLACTLVRSPELLLLDEPTVGVDPLSRRELWEIIAQLVERARPDGPAQHVLPRRGRALRAGRRAARGQGAGGGPAGGGERASPTGRSFRRRAARRAEPARGLQARLLDEPAIVDAVPEAGRVRFRCADGDGGAAIRFAERRLQA